MEFAKTQHEHGPQIWSLTNMYSFLYRSKSTEIIIFVPSPDAQVLVQWATFNAL